MNETPFKQVLCDAYDLDSDKYMSFLLSHTLYFRVRLLHPFIRIFYPDHLFHEKRLIERVARAIDFKEIQDEVDFYQHKYVVHHFFKDTLRFRLSGYRLLTLAADLFKHTSVRD